MSYIPPGTQPPTGYPPPVMPLPYAIAAPAKPTSVKVVGIFGIIIAAIGILNHGLGFLLYAHQPMAPGEMAWNIINSIIALALAALLLGSAIGLLRLSDLGRRLLMLWAGIYLVALAARLAAGAFWLVPLRLENLPLPPDQQAAAKVGAYIGLVLTVAVLSVYPVCALIWMSKPHVKAACLRDAGY